MSTASSWASIPGGWSGSSPKCTCFLVPLCSACRCLRLSSKLSAGTANDAKFDKLAYEFTSLLSVAYATTAALGGLLAFALFTLYPTFMGYMAGIFKDVMFMYAILFFGETFCLYLYYYGWKWLKSGAPFPPVSRWIFKLLSLIVAAFGLALLTGNVGPDMRTDTRWFMLLLYILPVAIGLWIIQGRKTTHIFIGILLNVFGTAIMQLANSWAGFMMSPTGVDGEGAFIGTVWQAFENILATPIAIHRMLGNLAFGGLVAGLLCGGKIHQRKNPGRARATMTGWAIFPILSQSSP